MISSHLAAEDKRVQEDYPLRQAVKVGLDALEREGLDANYEHGRVVGYLVGETFNDAPRTESILAVMHERDGVRRYWPWRETLKMFGGFNLRNILSQIIGPVEAQV